MRLFATGMFYLHESPRLSAEWLNDRDTVSQLRNSGVLLSTIVQMQHAERITGLYAVDCSIYDESRLVTEWMHASAFNVYWVIDYYIALSDKNARLFKYKPEIWTFVKTLKDSAGIFDPIDTEPQGWLPLTPAEARDAYKGDVKRFSYRKTPPPFWYGVPIIEAQPDLLDLDYGEA